MDAEAEQNRVEVTRQKEKRQWGAEDGGRESSVSEDGGGAKSPSKSAMNSSQESVYNFEPLLGTSGQCGSFFQGPSGCAGL